LTLPQAGQHALLDVPSPPPPAGLCGFVQSAIARLFAGRQGRLTANYAGDDGWRLPSP